MSRDRAGPAPAWSPAAGDGVAEAAAAAPSALAVVAHGGAALGFAEWDGRASAVARALVARGVRPGDRVALRFDTPAWADFAVCHLAVRRAGGVVVLVPPGAAPADARRAVAHAGAAAGLGPSHLAVPAAGGWWATAAELEAADDAGAELPSPPPPGEVAELLYRPLPLARPAPEARTHAQVAAGPAPAVAGTLVHGWAPGTAGSRFALAAAAVAASSGGPVVAVAPLAPSRLEAALAHHGPVALGLSPPLAAALVASADRRGPPPGVTRLVLDARPGPALAAALARAFPASPLAVVAGPGPAPAASVAAEAPAAVSQEPMLWHEQLAPGSFNLPCLVRRFRGPLDVAALAAALADLA
ncbi:MAG TPA: AMP-binding protein, partial [Acidimicrobiales bacterium]|nr:AMP-binding protein [Acidimicrobiales bacterium]